MWFLAERTVGRREYVLANIRGIVSVSPNLSTNALNMLSQTEDNQYCMEHIGTHLWSVVNENQLCSINHTPAVYRYITKQRSGRTVVIDESLNRTWVFSKRETEAWLKYVTYKDAPPQHIDFGPYGHGAYI